MGLAMPIAQAMRRNNWPMNFGRSYASRMFQHLRWMPYMLISIRV